MAGSQLKRLKASLREQGIIGPQQSKKQKKRKAEDERANNVRRLDKATKLQHIRESYNPFDLKHDVRGPKFQVTTSRPTTGNAAKGIQGRPTEAKAAGEETRRRTLLVEMQRRNKVGGILDRRFGEDDPSMAPEDKALERFAMEKQRNHKRDVFDLEDEAGEGFGLTHMGKSLSLDGPNLADDYNEDDLDADSDGANDEGEKAYLKRKQLTDGDYDDAEADGGQPERKRSKNEIMKEVIAKSKFHKYERQAEKDADEDLRMELDKELPQLQQLLQFGGKPKLAPSEEHEKEKFDREYDLRVKQLARSGRAQPTERTKTSEERAEEEAARLKELEEKRIKRMHGLAESESEHGDSDAPEDDGETPNGPIQFIEQEEEDSFGLGKGIKTRPTASELGFDDEDNFYIEDDLVADGAGWSPAESEKSSDEEVEDGREEESEEEDDGEDEFTKGLLDELEAHNPVFSLGSAEITKGEDLEVLPFCPETHEQLLELTKTVPVTSLPALVQRIRAQYLPQLDSGNKSKLGNFAVALIQHLAFLSSLPQIPPFSVLETLIRHIHSLAKTHAVQIANKFRSHLLEIKPLEPQLGDLIILTAISTIFPTSDHWHQVVSPAMLVIGKYLGQKIPTQLTDYTKGCYMSILALQFQRISKRYVPEVLNFTLNTLASLAPIKAKEKLGSFPLHEPSSGTRITNAQSVAVRKLTCLDCDVAAAAAEANGVKVAIIDTAVKIIETSAGLWSEKTSYFETYQPACNVLAHLQSKPCRKELPKALNESIKKAKSKVDEMLWLAHKARRSLELHHHRPQAIKSNFPKFEDSFDPNKHYDPDRDRAELAKLKAEHKRERKGAMRELRKDANFTAREKLRVKKAKDAAYEKKYKRLVAEIQGDEGREANAYEREKEQRKKAAKRR